MTTGYDPADFTIWAGEYRLRLQQETLPGKQRQQQMKQVNPKYILRNYMAETAIRNGRGQQGYSEVNRLLTILAAPYQEHPGARSLSGNRLIDCEQT